MVVKKELFQFKKRHVVALEKMDFKEQVATVLERFEKQVNTWREWKTVPLSFDAYKRIMKSMQLGKGATEVIEEKVNDDFEGFLTDGSPQITVWLFYNILTWYITHHAVSLNHRVELENRLRKAVTHFDA